MSRKCPKGYSMSTQGVCTQSLGGDSPLWHHSSNCNDCMHMCWQNSNHCFGAFSYPPGGQCSCNMVCNSWVTVEYPCNHDPQQTCSESGCASGDWTYYCYSNADCSGQCSAYCSGVGYSGPGGGGGGRGRWAGGGRIKRRRSR